MHAVQASKRMRIRICIDINIFRYEEILTPVSGNTLESSLMRVTRVVQIRSNVDIISRIPHLAIS